jgi:hypothetical protein
MFRFGSGIDTKVERLQCIIIQFGDQLIDLDEPNFSIRCSFWQIVNLADSWVTFEVLLRILFRHHFFVERDWAH